MDREIIKRYLRGECSPEERAEIKKLMLTGEADALFDEVLNEGWNDEPQEVEENDANQLAEWKNKFREKAGQQKNIKPYKKTSWLNVAAVLAFFVLSAGTYAWFHLKNAQPATLAIQEIINPNGKLLKIKLSDNSTITLNAASKLKYPASFNGRTREVYLEGEAFFNITHDAAHPFIVHTSKITVSVLGTSFNIKSYREDKKISVAVATGKVGVLANKKGSEPYFLLPGDKLAYSPVDETVQQTKVDAGEVDAWQKGLLIYHNETLENISRQLERWYGIKMIFKNSKAANIRFNLKQKNDRLENVMQTLKYAGGIQYVISGKTVTIW